MGHGAGREIRWTGAGALPGNELMEFLSPHPTLRFYGNRPYLDHGDPKERKRVNICCSSSRRS